MTIKLKLNLSSASSSGLAASSSSVLPTPPASSGTVLKISRKGKEKAVDPPASAVVPVGANGDGPAGGKPKLKIKKDVAPSTPLTTTPPPIPTPPTTSAKKPPRGRPPKLATSAKSTPSRRQKQTSAIPPHVLSATSTPKGPLTPLPTGLTQTDDVIATSPDPISGDSMSASPVKSEPEDYSSASRALSGDGEDDNPFLQRGSSDLPTPADSAMVDAQFEASAEPDAGTPLSTERAAPAPRKLPKKPLKELVVKIIIELRRKDGYALFEDPVDLESFPDYLDIIGGRDHMMDISTMSTKNDDGEYRSMDDVEADLRLLVDSAQKFNPEGTVPHREAAKILSIGLKFMDRYRPQVRTPSPSPDPDDSREVSLFSGREATFGPDGAAGQNIPPGEYIPVAMLAFPPNSAAALSVGWSVTGGKRSHMKKVTRSKEKFYGKWRHWDLDGSRDVAELEDIAEVWTAHRNNAGRLGGNRRVLDWKGLRREGEWWDWGGLGGVQGLPPLPGATYPRPPRRRTRELGAVDWGLYPETDAEVAFIASRTGETDLEKVVSEHIRPIRPRAKKGQWMPPPNFTNLYELPLGRRPEDWLANIHTGGTLGEAYTRSVVAFLDGAVSGATKRHGGAAVDGLAILRQTVVQDYHGGVLGSRVFDHLRPSFTSPAKSGGENTAARDIRHRALLRRQFASTIPLDLQPLLRVPHEFMRAGTVGKSGVRDALGQVAADQVRLAALLREERGVSYKRKRASASPDGPGTGGAGVNGIIKKIKLENGNAASLPGSGASSPLSAAPDSPPPASTPLPDRETSGRQKRIAELLESNRLELISLIKCYPLSALKKMNRETAMRLLPPGVWNLMAPLPTTTATAPPTTAG